MLELVEFKTTTFILELATLIKTSSNESLMEFIISTPSRMHARIT